MKRINIFLIICIFVLPWVIAEEINLSEEQTNTTFSEYINESYSDDTNETYLEENYTDDEYVLALETQAGNETIQEGNGMSSDNDSVNSSDSSSREVLGLDVQESNETSLDVNLNETIDIIQEEVGYELPSVVTFDGETTNFSIDGSPDGGGIILEKSEYGKVVWNSKLDFGNANFDKNLVILDKIFSLDKSKLPSCIDSLAKVVLRNVECNAEIYYYKGFTSDKEKIFSEGSLCNDESEPSCKDIVCNPLSNEITFYAEELVSYAARTVEEDSSELDGTNLEKSLKAKLECPEVDRRPTLNWPAVPGATKYDLWINRVGDKVQPYYKKTVTGTNIFEVDKDFKSGNYKWWVRPWANGKYIGPWSQTYNFTITGGIPAKSTLIAPSGVVTKQKQNLIWNEVCDSAWYNVWVNKDGKTYLNKWIQGQNNSWDTLNNLQWGTYDWWIRTWNADGNGPWSGKMTFVFGKSIPLYPNSVITDKKPTLRWEAVDLATQYQVWINKDGKSYLNKVINTSANYTLENNLTPGNYQWWVRARKSSGYGAWSDPMNFSYEEPKLVIDSVVVENANPTAGTTTQITVTAEITDTNGVADINTVKADFTVGSPTGGTSIASNARGSCTNVDTDTINCVMTYDMQFYDIPMDYTVEVYAESGLSGSAKKNDSFTYSELIALELDATNIAFGTLDVNESSEILGNALFGDSIATIKNQGNVIIDANASATDFVSGANSFNANNAQIRFDSLNYFALTNGGAIENSLNLGFGTNEVKSVDFNLTIPSGVKPGLYNSNIFITAIKS